MPVVNNGGVATRTHVTGAIRNDLVIVTGAFSEATCFEIKSSINAQITNGDTIAVDFGASFDGTIIGIGIEATYTDTTSEINTTVSAIAGTLTLTLTQNKILDEISIYFSIGTGPSGPGRTTYMDMLEVRLTTAIAVGAEAGRLQSPFNFIGAQGAGAAGGAGGGAGGNTASISAGGTYIYIAAFNNLGFPTMIRIATTLTSDGTVVFEPGAGGRIGVQAEKFTASNVWVAGQFDGTNTLERSEDFGASWTVKDGGAFGTIRTFDIGPDSDERVLIFDGDNGDLLESVDSGDNWSLVNGTVTPLLNAIGRSPIDTREIAFVNQGDVSDSVSYTVNSGTNLEDYQTGVYPNADGTKVIAK